MKNPAPRILRRLQRISKRLGVDVILSWTDTALHDQPNPVTGKSSAQRTSHSIKIKALKHDIAPARSGYRVFSEIAIGDCIIDFVTPLVRITDSGDTPLLLGSTVDEYALKAANRETTGLPALAIGVDLNSLANLTAEIDGIRWVQREVGATLVKSWDATIGGKRICQTLLFRRAT